MLSPFCLLPPGSDLFNAATEFVRNIGEASDDDDEGRQQQANGAAEAPYMDVDMDDAAPGPGQADGQQQPEEVEAVAGGGGAGAAGKGRNYRKKKGGWVTAEDDEGQQGGQEAQAGQQQQEQGESQEVRSLCGGQPWHVGSLADPNGGCRVTHGGSVERANGVLPCLVSSSASGPVFRVPTGRPRCCLARYSLPIYRFQIVHNQPAVQIACCCCQSFVSCIRNRCAVTCYSL